MSCKRKISAADWKRKLDAVHVPKQQLNRLVMDYLLVEGNRGAAEAFSREAGLDPGLDLNTLEERRVIREHIMNSQIDEVISLVNHIDPHILDSDKELLFKLRVQKLVEYIKNNQVSEALAYGQEILAPAARGNTKLLRELEKAMSLLAFDDLADCPMGSLATLGHRQKLASAVNSAIFKSTDGVPHCKLQMYLKLLSWSEKRLESTVEFPKLAEL